MRRLTCCVLFGVLICVGCSWADTTWVAINAQVSGEWTLEGSPYMLRGNLTIPAGDTLLIEAGVHVKFTGYGTWSIPGTLEADGSETDSVSVDFAGNGAIVCSGGRLNLSFADLGYANAVGDVTCPVDLSRSAHAQLSDCAIHDCNGDITGGLRLSSSSEADVRNCYISRCDGSKRGALSVSGNSRLHIADCILESNTSHFGTGGAICVTQGLSSGSSLIAERCQFLYNVASDWSSDPGGGAVFSDPYCSVSFEHCAFFANRVDGQNARGGALYCVGAVRVSSCTFTGNTAALVSAAYLSIGDTTGRPAIENSIFVGNTAGSTNAKTVDVSGSLARFIVQYSDFQGNFGRNFPLNCGVMVSVNARGDSCDLRHNISVDPQFVNTAGDFHLTALSHCIDAGNPDSPRDPDGTIADMGAFPYEQPSAVDLATLHPSEYKISAYPNPFNPTTTIKFDVARTGMVSVKIYDLLGREAGQIVNERLAAGTYSYAWNAGSLPSGMYFVMMSAGDARLVRKILLLK